MDRIPRPVEPVKELSGSVLNVAIEASSSNGRFIAWHGSAQD